MDINLVLGSRVLNKRRLRMLLLSGLAREGRVRVETDMYLYVIVVENQTDSLRIK